MIKGGNGDNYFEIVPSIELLSIVSLNTEVK